MFYIIILALSSLTYAQSLYFKKPQHFYDDNGLKSFNPQTSLYGNPDMQKDHATVRGKLISEDSSALPAGTRIVVLLADVSLQDAQARPINSLALYGSYRFPISFEIPYSMAQVLAESNVAPQYAIQARIEKDGQLLYINDQYTPVQLVPAPVKTVDVFMKKISTWSGSRNDDMLSTGSPDSVNTHFCLQTPDIGPCKASIEQYYFDARLGSCQIFFWGGCGGNQNRFDSRTDCERTCVFYRRANFINNAKQREID